ncbi:kinase-like domain-containing protein [Ephemerocybe angulata]|uniref:non-specific serine/threonine protein kinase n=1 Tax=Ephemerocybe angulata TaxID=980116 RepID=A0A8H6I705_9AGAR|nr:kinase-like domain-containing protein [Tulosesus angulatus]
MESFPEEPLSLSAADGFGYFPADINQTLRGGRYTIVRKLGWGPRSSTWLAWDKDGEDSWYWAIQIFTAAASEAVESKLVPIFSGREIDFSDPSTVPIFPESLDENILPESFRVTSIHGEHVCLVLRPYGLPFSDVLREAKSRRAGLPVHVVEFTTQVIVQVLDDLHNEKIRVMHAGVKLENLELSVDGYSLETHISENPPAKTQIFDGLPVVRSQPLANYMVKWNDPMSRVVDCWMLVLAGFGHGMYASQGAPYTPESGFDYSSAPETLLGNPTCGLSTDIWMLGCLVFHLLTGSPLLTSTGTPAERLGEIRDVLQGWIPSSWLGDATVQALPKEDPSAQSLEQRLKQNLKKDEAFAAYRFLRKCLVIDPEGRASSRYLLLEDQWVEEGAQCSCGFKALDLS